MSKEVLTTGYKLTKAYFRFATDGIFYRRRYILDANHFPEVGKPLLVVMNHQNTFCDILCVLFARYDRRFHFIARADAFDIHPLFRKFLYWAGVLPAYRMSHEGVEALGNNNRTFEETEKNLLEGRTVLIFPEAGHQAGHWLGYFSLGYLRMAFEAAASTNFEKEIFILPAANHYTKYQGLRQECLSRFGTPISLKPWYGRYPDKPRTCQREVNALVRAQIREMMLDVQNQEHYADIDFVRESRLGDDFARSLNLNPRLLPQKLQADKELVKRLEEAQTDYSQVAKYRTALQDRKFEDSQVARRPGWGGTLLRCLLLLATLPVGLFCLWPSIPAWYIPKYFNDRFKDDDGMYLSSFQLAINTLLLMPLMAIITLLVTGLAAGWGWGILHALSLPFLCIVEWHYGQLVKRTIRDLRFLCQDTAPLRELRTRAFDPLKKTLYHE